ncbi:substrate-binding periplasmic protein [Trichothermofontia sp.]
MPSMSRSWFLRQLLLGVGGGLLLANCRQGRYPGGGDISLTPLTIATDPVLPPFQWRTPEGELLGFDIDLMRLIGEAAGVSIRFLTLPLDRMVPALNLGVADAAISALLITVEALEQVTFSRPYFRTGLAIAHRRQDTDLTTPERLKGKRIAVQRHSWAAKWVESWSDSRIYLSGSVELALASLVKEEVDGVIHEAPILQFFIHRQRLTGITVERQWLTEAFYGIAVPKASPTVAIVNQALATLIESGAYDKLYQQWFQTPAPPLPEIVPSSLFGS